MRLERRLRPKLLREFNKTAKEAANVYEVSPGDSGLTRVFSEHAVRLADLLKPTYQTAIESTAKRVVSEMPKSWGAPAEFKDVEGEVGRLIRDFVNTFALNQSKTIAATSRGIVREAIVDASVEGAGEAVVAKAIRKSLGGSVGRFRSLTIARTETHTASQKAGLSVVDSLQTPELVKVWVSVEDDETRISHIEADGEKEDMNAPFQIGGSSLQFPGDPSGEAAEVINCRCVLVYENKF